MIDLSTFHVIAVVSNPMRFASRWSLFKMFEEDITRKGATLWTLEMATGARKPQITRADDPKHTQIWNSSLPGELWQKEAMLNVALQQLTIKCPNWRYVAWVDADVRFELGQLEETVHSLQHWDIVQMFSHAIDFGPDDESIQTQLGYMYCYWKGIEPKNKSGYLAGGHPGFCWAARREAINKIGTFIDWGVLGSGDRHMAAALLGRVDTSVHGDMHPTYKRWLKVWEARAEREIKRNVGYVPGTIRHSWHGKKADRGYSSRWKILVKHQFNPETDIKRDVSGLWQLVTDCPRQIMLRDDIRKYFRARNEDSIDTL